MFLGRLVKSAALSRELVPFVDMLIEKIEELNYRSKEVSLQTLVKLTDQVDHRYLVDKLLEVPIGKQPVEKAAWRPVMTRMEIY